jgi:ParB-like chromosome segregation protein Spo0J
VSKYQVMPPLSADEYDALRADIAEHGIRVPVDVDETGQVLDGHHRSAIAAELGIDYPTRVVTGLDEQGKYDHALTVNVARRQLTREQRRELITAEIERCPVDSDRAIARRCGCDHKTVGSVRRELAGEIPQYSREEAEEISHRITEDVRVKITRADHGWQRALVAGISPAVIAKGMQDAREQLRAEIAAEMGEDFAELDEALFCSRIDFLAAVQASEKVLGPWKRDDPRCRDWLRVWAQVRPAQHQEQLEIVREGLLRDAAIEGDAW